MRARTLPRTHVPPPIPFRGGDVPAAGLNTPQNGRRLRGSGWRRRSRGSSSSAAGARSASAARIGATSVATEKPGSQSSWWHEHDPAGLQAGDVVGDEVGQRTLDRLAVDVGPTGGRDDGDVGPESVDARRSSDRSCPGTAPIRRGSRCGTGGRHRRPAGCARRARRAGARPPPGRARWSCTASARAIRSRCSWYETPRSPRHTSSAWCMPGVRPHAAVQARVRGGSHVVAEVDGLAAGHREEAIRARRPPPPGAARSRSCRPAWPRCWPGSSRRRRGDRSGCGRRGSSRTRRRRPPTVRPRRRSAPGRCRRRGRS